MGENVGIKDALTEIVEKYDVQVFENIERLNALLMDLAPFNDKERKLIIMCLKEGILTQLYDAKNSPMPEFIIRRCIKRLVSDIWITESAAERAIEILAGVIGVKYIHTSVADGAGEQMVSAEKILLKGETQVKDNLDLMRVLGGVDVVGFKAFAGNKSITAVRFPHSVKKIMANAFMNCTNIEYVELGNQINEISMSAFNGCIKIKEIKGNNNRYTCRNGILIDEKEKLTIKAENRVNVAVINIPEGIEIITARTFEGSFARTLVIPESVKEIQPDSLRGMGNLEEIIVNSGNRNFRAINGVLYDKKGEILIYYPTSANSTNYIIEDAVKIIGKKSFGFVNKLHMITFAESVDKIECAAFEFCGGLESLIIPYGISFIGEKAFQYCMNLKSVMLSKQIQEIGDCAFYQCISLENVNIPADIIRIGNYAFWGCKNLSTVTIQKELKEIGYGAFDGCENIYIRINNNAYVIQYCKSHNIAYSIIG